MLLKMNIVNYLTFCKHIFLFMKQSDMNIHVDKILIENV